MNRQKFLSFIILAVLVFTQGCQTATETPSTLAATLSELAGQVEARQTEKESFTLAGGETILKANGQVQTGTDGHVRLDLSTGTIIRVGPTSIFTLVSNDEVEGGLFTKLKLQAGEVFIILKGGSAEVETPSGIASVRGSYMKVEVDPETSDIYVTCLEGNCSASNPAGTVNFSNGEKAVLLHQDPVTGTWTPPNVEPMTPDEFQEWLDENPEAKDLFDQAMATLTALAPPTQLPTLEFTLTVSPSLTVAPTLETAVPSAPSSSECFQILQPQSGSSLPKEGQVTFEWESQPGAQSYTITFTDSFGRQATIETTNTSDTRYIEIFPNGGEYNWSVAAIGADGNEICATASASFTKPQGDPTPIPTKIPPPTDTDEEVPACIFPDDVCNPNNVNCYDAIQCG